MMKGFCVSSPFQILVPMRGNPGKVGHFHYIGKMAVEVQNCGRHALAQQGTTEQKLWGFVILTPPICIWILKVQM